jgi:hypothetical protein|tara:strand:- start:229 stop:528 length:300 start_codon:yes stop_codon:yes gene_type:complete
MAVKKTIKKIAKKTAKRTLRRRLDRVRMADLFGPKMELTIAELARNHKVPESKLKIMDSLCKAHDTSLTKIPSWLLNKQVRRLNYWFETEFEQWKKRKK